MTDMEFAEIAELMKHPSHFKPRTKAKWPIRVRPPRCETCSKEPPACLCLRELP